MAYLSRRYKSLIARIITKIFDFNTNYDYESFLEEIEDFMNFKKDTLKKLAFQIYDFDNDHNVCELDLYTYVKNFRGDDDGLFLQVYAQDLTVIEKEINKRK